MLESFDKGNIKEMVIDCWENEPKIDRKLLYKSILSTPHIAGYSYDGKANATRMAAEAVCRFFNLDLLDRLRYIHAPQPAHKNLDLTKCLKDKFARAVLDAYDVRVDSDRLKENPEDFEKQRGDYPFRRELSAYTLIF